MQKSNLNHYFQNKNLISLNTEYWDRDEIEKLANKMNLTFKKTYKWLWDKKERELKRNTGKT